MSNDSVQPHRRQPTRLCSPWDSPGKNIGVGCHFLLQCMKVKSQSEVIQSCWTLRDPMDCSLPGSSVPGIFQARVLEWVPLPSPVQLLSCVLSLHLCNSRTAARQASLSFSISLCLLKLMSTELVMLSSHLILCCPLLLQSSIFPSIRVFSNESSLHQVVKIFKFQYQHQSFQ